MAASTWCLTPRNAEKALACASGLFFLNSILDRIVTPCATGRKDQTACKPGSVRLIAQVWQPFLWDACCQAPHATHPGRRRDTAHARPLFGLAPGGVYRASPVARPAVGSYPTLSPLPPRGEAVCFLWHFPSACAGRPLAVALYPWSPDFPPACRYQHASGCPAVWSGAVYRAKGRPWPAAITRPRRSAVRTFRAAARSAHLP